MGGRVFRNYYKGVEARERGGFGWGWVEGLGETADNCNRIKINELI